MWLKGLKDKIKYHLDDDFDGEGDNIMDRLPTIDEALKLKEENEKLKEEYEKLASSIIPREEGIQKLKEENEKFGNHIAEQEQELQELRVENTKIETLSACNGMQKVEIEELKEEIEKLTPQGEIKEVIQKLKEEIWRWKELPAEFGLDSRADTYNMIYKLKEEREHFNQEFHKTLQHQVDDKEQYEKEIEDLKREIPDKKGKKLSQADKELLELIWSEAEHQGPSFVPESIKAIQGKKLMKRLLK